MDSMEKKLITVHLKYHEKESLESYLNSTKIKNTTRRIKVVGCNEYNFCILKMGGTQSCQNQPLFFYNFLQLNLKRLRAQFLSALSLSQR